jgi:hypothetical protein
MEQQQLLGDADRDGHGQGQHHGQRSVGPHQRDLVGRHGCNHGEAEAVRAGQPLGDGSA